MKAAITSVRDLVMPIFEELLASVPTISIPKPQLPYVWDENRVPRILNKPEDNEPCEESLDFDSSEPETSHDPEPEQPNNRLLVKLLSPHARMPTRGSESAAGYDLYCAEDKSVIIQPGNRKLVDTGIVIAMDHPATLYARIAPRSGLSVKGLDIGAGVVDADYRGSVKILLINNSSTPFQINPGDRMAQLILERIENTECVLVDSLPVTTRGNQGFGST